MVKNKNSIVSLMIAVCMCLCLLAAFFSGGQTAYAQSILTSDGVYSVPIDLSGLAMGADNFSSTATVEKSGDNYYMTFGHSSTISNLVLESGNKQTGYTVKTEGGWTYYTYTLSVKRLSSELSFSAYINAMNRSVNLTIRLNLSGAKRTGDYSFEGERPAEYVPVITTSAGDSEMEKGSVYVLPSATAFLGEEECEVEIKAFYGENEVAIQGNKFTLDQAGEYTVIYRAESSAYKTNLGNNAYSEYTVTINSKVGATTLAKYEDDNNVFQEGTAIQANSISSGEVYNLATQKLKEISNNFSLINITYYAQSGEQVVPDDDITLYLIADSTFDRNQIVVYHMADDGTLTKIDCSGYGRYVRIQTDKTGTFIVCIPGVDFVMPMWGYVLIILGSLVLIAGLTTSIVLIVKKHRKKVLQDNANS